MTLSALSSQLSLSERAVSRGNAHAVAKIILPEAGEHEALGKLAPLQLMLNHLMGAETGKQNWHARLFLGWPGFVYRVSVFSYLVVCCLCKCAGVSFELKGRWRGGVTAIFEFGGHTAVQATRSSTSTQHPRILCGTRRVTWGLLSQTRASWTGSASFDEGSSSLAVCLLQRQGAVRWRMLQKAQARNGNRQEHAGSPSTLNFLRLLT